MIRMQPSESCWGYNLGRLLFRVTLNNCYEPNQKTTFIFYNETSSFFDSAEEAERKNQFKENHTLLFPNIIYERRVCGTPHRSRRNVFHGRRARSRHEQRAPRRLTYRHRLFPGKAIFDKAGA